MPSSHSPSPSASHVSPQQPTADSSNPPTYAAFSPPTLAHGASHTQVRSAILVHQKSPLLAATPPQITRVLAYSHPFLLPLNKVVGLLTWTTEDPWESFLLLAAFWAIVLYGDAVTRYAGPIIVVLGLILGMYARRYSPLSSTGWTGEKGQKGHKRAESESNIKHHKSLEEIVDTLKLWHSRPARVSRAILWRSKLVRRICVFLTGLNFGEPRPKDGGPALPPRRKSAQEIAAALAAKRRPDSPGVRFTFSIYENQRRWLGIGWTSSMLAYERAPWTDEHLNPTPPKDEFELPEIEGGHARWRWVQGSEWKVESVGSGKGEKRSSGGDGWIYYDNSWRDGRPGQDGWGRYTRRRKWYRDAELVEVTPSTEVTPMPSPKLEPGANSTEPAAPSPLQAQVSSDSGSKGDSTNESTMGGTTLHAHSDTDAASAHSKRSWFKKKQKRRSRSRSRSGKGSDKAVTIASSTSTNVSRRSDEDDDLAAFQGPAREDEWRLGDDVRMQLDI
ncbi:Pex24p-domain-containing protein [Westerdykella ornata]|uniref:Pex24p-domain-containing protein n=1 Tax=Westerdykella ornata TaxID=318751 RepID=A0A6A6JCW3_WESOR|nr:Pex24p-domain-containing protein [Westerdykella ornata]KAF2274107.1 Pex24p-domain-containing protein [Westerdykella ornata]